MKLAGDNVTDDTGIVEELSVTECHGTEHTEIVEELNAAEGHVTEETEVGGVNERALETEEKVLSEEGVVAHSVNEKAEKSSVAEAAEETVISWKDQAEEKTVKVDGKEVEAEGEKAQAVGEQAEAEGEQAQGVGEEAEAEVEGDDEANVADMVVEGEKAQAVGEQAEAEGKQAQAVGEEAVAEVEGDDEANVADMVVEGEKDQAVGEQAEADGEKAQAVREEAEADLDGNVADMVAEGEKAQAVGEQAEADGKKTQAVREQAEADVDGNMGDMVAEGEKAEAVGKQAEAESEKAQAVGEEAEVEAKVEGDDDANVADMVAEGEKAQAVGEQAQAVGEEAEVEAEGDDEANVADGVAETGMVEVVDMADDAMEETTEAEETEAADEEAEGMEVEGEDEETNRGGSGGKRKRGKSSKAMGKLLSKKKMEEDVCFICFDGGELVLCDRRGCPKAYHPSCVNRDEAFFRAKGRWNCGWHLCSNCEKNAHYMCYTCTFSLCKGCTEDAVFLCVRGNKGFCETCLKTVMLIEKNEQGNKDTIEVDFDDKTSWEYLFKDYWIDLKQRLSLTVDELAQAKNPWKGASGHKQESRDEPYDINNGEGSEEDNSGNLDLAYSKKRKAKKRLRTRGKGKGSSSPATATGSGGPSADDSTGWGSKELLEFVMHMRNGDKSALSQFDVQALLLEYIKRNKLRDPRRKSQIICDIRLQNLFGKPRVGHFEMLKLLESHFLVKEDSQADDLQGSVVDTEGNQLEADGNSDTPAKASKDKRRKARKKCDGRGPQSNIDDFGAIDIHNINLIYLKRNLAEDLLVDLDNFGDKVVHSFVRIRISGSGQKQDLYRLVQVIGTCKAAEPYKVGKRMTDILLEILNLNKTEIISIDIISNQDFTEDECKRLRQSIKCGLINRLTVGDVQEKALALQAVRVKDWLETEIVRLSHLRDRASEKGRRKELRECVEKLQLLKTPEERQRRLEETLEIHVDPNMDPSYESEEDEDEGDDKRQESYIRPTGSGFGRKGRGPISPRGGRSSIDSWSGTRNYFNMNRELSRNMSNKGYFNKAENATVAGETVNDSWGHGRDTETQQTNHWEEKQNISSVETGVRRTQSALPSNSSPGGGSENPVALLSSGVAQSAANINESEKNWHYKDPSGKVQGPFSMVQLRKWNHTGYFPANLRVWKTSGKEEDSVLVTDALAGKFQKDPSFVDSSFPKAQMVHNSHLSPIHCGTHQGALFPRGTEGQAGGVSWGSQNEINSSSGRGTPQSVDVPKYSSDGWGTRNHPSPTPSQTPLGGARGQAYESNWSPSPAHRGGSVLGGNGVLQPTAVGGTPENALRASGNDHSSSLPVINASPKSENATLLGSPNALRMHGQATGSAPVFSSASMNHVPDVNNLVSNLQNLVQTVTSRAPASEASGWGSGSVPKQEMTASGLVAGSESQPWEGASSQRMEQNNAATVPAQHHGHSYWSNAPSINNAPSSMNTGNLAGNLPALGFSGVPHSDPWRPPASSTQTYIQPPTQLQAPWGVGVPDNQSAVPRTGQENQNASWVPMAGNPKVAWGGPVPGNTNMNWVPQSQGPGWTAPSQGPAPGNVVTGWVPPGQGPPLVSANTGWAPPGQGPALRNANPGWSAPNATQNGDRFSNQRDRGSHVGDPGFSGGKPWNRQSSFGGGGGGGGSSRPPFKGQRVCWFFESGHCKKGASCDFLHPDH